MSEEMNMPLNMPPKVAAAIVAVMEEVPKLAKTEKNTHGSYNFASIDDFLEAVRPLCAKHGLIIAQDEESFDMKDNWLVITYRFVLSHSSGETWSERPCRTIMVNAKMGSQAFGAAQSYALKQYMRSLFQIATGEKGIDADEHPPGQLANARRAVEKWHGPLGKTELKKRLRQFAAELADCTDESEIDGLEEGYREVLNQARKEDEMASWVFGDEDQQGALEAIEKKRREVMTNPLDAG